jgi:hypothetical protein
MRKGNFLCLPRFQKEVHNERNIAVDRKNWLHCGSDAGGERTAAMYSLIGSAKLNGLDPFPTCGMS